MGYDWAERYVFMYLGVLIIYFFFLFLRVGNMYIGISLECSFGENLLIVSIHHHAVAHHVGILDETRLQDVLLVCNH